MAAPSTHSDRESHSEGSTIVADRPTTGSAHDLESGFTADISMQEKDERKHPESTLVTWNGPSDPENPQNWPFRQKFAAVAIVSTITFIR